jgi:hypothetical protein
MNCVGFDFSVQRRKIFAQFVIKHDGIEKAFFLRGNMMRKCKRSLLGPVRMILTSRVWPFLVVWPVTRPECQLPPTVLTHTLSPA